jgi:hypothetical protein
MVVEARITCLKDDDRHEETPDILCHLIEHRRRGHGTASERQILSQSAWVFDVALDTLPPEGSIVTLRNKRDLWCWIWAIADYGIMLASGEFYSTDVAGPIIDWLRKLNDSLVDTAGGRLLDDTIDSRS